MDFRNEALELCDRVDKDIRKLESQRDSLMPNLAFYMSQFIDVYTKIQDLKVKSDVINTKLNEGEYE